MQHTERMKGRTVRHTDANGTQRILVIKSGHLQGKVTMLVGTDPRTGQDHTVRQRDCKVMV